MGHLLRTELSSCAGLLVNTFNISEPFFFSLLGEQLVQTRADLEFEFRFRRLAMVENWITKVLLWDNLTEFLGKQSMPLGAS